MGLYTGTDAWVNDIYQFETTDVVEGGVNGKDNQPLKELADRTAYLRARVGLMTHFNGYVSKTGNSSYTAADQGYTVMAQASGVNTLTLADASTLAYGAIIPITSYCNTNCVLNIAGSNGQQFWDGGNWRNFMYMHHKEHLMLIALNDHFRVVNASGNFYAAGEEIKGRKVLNNTLLMQGQTLQRNQYPRLWEFVNSLTAGEVITENDLNNGGRAWQGFFTNGDGSTWFRLPDERGMFDRMMDLGRGIDTSRNRNVTGGYESDILGPLKPTIWTGQAVGKGGLAEDGIGFLGTNGDGGYVSGTEAVRVNKTNARTASMTPGSETIVKNIGKYNLIRF